MTDAGTSRAAGEHDRERVGRPWLEQYAPGIPTEIQVPGHSALAMFRERVAADPGRPLIHYFDATITAGEADRITDALATGLVELGVEKGDRIALYLQNVPQYPLTMIAAWKIGAIAVAINPMNRSREVEFLLNDSGAKILVALDSLLEEVADVVRCETGVERVLTCSGLEFLGPDVPPLLVGLESRREAGGGSLGDLIERHRGSQPPAFDPAVDEPAVLTYTSGTTGPPKGAVNTHANIVFQSHAYSTWIGLGQDDVVFGLAPLFHVTGLICHIGICCCVPAPLVLAFRFDPAVAAQLIERWGVTFTAGATTAFVALMNDPAVSGEQLGSLRRVVCGGAPLPPATTEAFEEFCGVYLHNAFGMTETTAASHVTPIGVRAPIDESSGTLSVGVPIFETVARVVDDAGRDLPPGEIGEFVVAGPGVVPGYWGQPEESRRAMGGGEMRTGDVGFADAEGWFYLVDRKKELIVASGYKVWPREVEDVLYSHPAVLEAAVIGVPDGYRGETVKAYVSLRAGRECSDQELIAFCKSQMAAYKYPRSVEFVEELPKTATGKILRRSLRERQKEG